MGSLRRRDLALCLLVVAFGVWRLAPGLAHPHLHDWDEAVHMAAARGTFQTPLSPHIYAAPLDGTDLKAWWSAHIWLHKPVLPFWLGAAWMHLLGVTPLVLRLQSLLGQLGCALAIFLLARELCGRPLAVAGALAFLTLPFGWDLTQGEMFGDVTDCTLAGFTAVAMLLLLLAIRRDSWRLAALAGAACGAAFLCKTGLGLLPLGVAMAFALLRARGGAGLRWQGMLAFAVVGAAVAVPWNVYSAQRWPEVYRVEAAETRAHLFPSKVDIGPWLRPADAIFNEINENQFAPIPAALTLLAGLWLAWRAWGWRKELIAPGDPASPPPLPALVAVACALWLWASWIGLSFARAKVPAATWEAAPVVLIALALLARDAIGRPVLAAATVGATLGPLALSRFSWLGVPASWLPRFFVQTRQRPENLAGVLLALGLAAIAAVLVWRGRGFAVRRATGAAAALALSWMFVVQLPKAQAARAASHHPAQWDSYTQDAGLALGRVGPGTLFLTLERDPPASFPLQSLMFWSGLDAYRGLGWVQRAVARGSHPYAVSTVALPYAQVPGVPPHAWTRAFDLTRPDPTMPLPTGLRPLNTRVGNLELLGLACGDVGGGRGRVALFARLHGPASSVAITLVEKDGREVQNVSPEAALVGPHRLSTAPWFILPVRAPACADLRAIEVGSHRWEGPFVAQ